MYGGLFAELVDLSQLTNYIDYLGTLYCTGMEWVWVSFHVKWLVLATFVYPCNSLSLTSPPYSSPSCFFVTVGSTLTKLNYKQGKMGPM